MILAVKPGSGNIDQHAASNQVGGNDEHEAFVFESRPQRSLIFRCFFLEKDQMRET